MDGFHRLFTARGLSDDPLLHLCLLAALLSSPSTILRAACWQARTCP